MAWDRARSEYLEKLRDPYWQKKRLEILERDKWSCLECGDTKTTLHVHHLFYGVAPWAVPDFCLRTLCENCHESANHVAVRQNQDGVDQYFYSLLVLGDLFRQYGYRPGDILDFAFQISRHEDFQKVLAVLPSTPPPPTQAEIDKAKREAGQK